MNRHVYLVSLLLATGCIGEPSALSNTDFNLWCGDSLCSWTTEKGKIRRVATWDDADYGVELASTPTVISQEANLSALGTSCARFSFMGNVQAEAEVRLELDFSSDGTVDYSEGVPSLAWRRVDLLVNLPPQPYSSLKVLLDKQGKGTAIFAGLAMKSAEHCGGDPIHLSHLPIGSLCTDDADCDSEHCVEWIRLQPTGNVAVRTCAECRVGGECSEGFVCGLKTETPSGLGAMACVPLEGQSNGTLCTEAAQCEHDVCRDGVCAECWRDADCGDGGKCGSVRAETDLVFAGCIAPGMKPSGASCGTDDECASGACCLVCVEPGKGCTLP